VEISIIEMIQDYNLKYPRFTSTSIRSFIDEISKETKKDDKYCGEVLSKFDFKSLLLKKNEPEKKKKETGDSFLKPEEKESKNSGKDKDKVKDEPDSGKVKEIIKSTTDRFIGEIKLSVEHFLQENPKSSVGKIILTGEYIRNIDRYIEQEIEYKVEMLNINDYFPLKNIKIAAGYSEDGNYILDPVAIGMALRGLNQ